MSKYDLFQAAERGDAAEVRRLIESGGDVNAKLPSGATALIIASQAGHYEVVQTVLAK